MQSAMLHSRVPDAFTRRAAAASPAAVPRCGGAVRAGRLDHSRTEASWAGECPFRVNGPLRPRAP
jgi:hypothetical protein